MGIGGAGAELGVLLSVSVIGAPLPSQFKEHRHHQPEVSSTLPQRLRRTRATVYSIVAAPPADTGLGMYYNLQSFGQLKK